MKALELTVYPKLKWPRSGAEIEPYRKQFRQERKVIESKRLTDPELAAEYYAQDAKCRHEQWIEAVRGDDDYEDWERAAQSRMYEQPAMTAVTPAACLRIAEALDVDTADYPIVRELVSALKELVKLNEEVKP